MSNKIIWIENTTMKLKWTPEKRRQMIEAAMSDSEFVAITIPKTCIIFDEWHDAPPEWAPDVAVPDFEEDFEIR